MGRKGGRKGPATLFDKVKALDPDFVETIYSATDEKLNEKLAGLAKTATTFENARDNDHDLKSLREQLKEAGKTYSEPLTACKLKRKLIYKILEERGKVP
jgi:ABC-type Fe3+-hydroxamate transport system substrate-binding protein